MFLGLETLRDSCYACPYASGFRAGDLTFGDFWGVQKVRPDVMEDAERFNERRGISCLLANNEHGRKALERFGSKLNLREVSFDDIASGNDQLRHPSVLPADRDECLRAFRDGGWDGVAKWWKWHHEVPDRVKRRIKNAVKGVLSDSVVDRIKKIRQALGKGLRTIRWTK
jgi:hypothetical protein